MLSDNQDLIITGIPRGGTTLAAALVDGLKNTLCLSEPVWQNEWSKQVREKGELISRIEADFIGIRAAVLAGKMILDRRSADGKAISNYYKRTSEGISQNFQLLHVGKKNLSPDFLLGIKHNDNYSSVLPELVGSGKYKIIAVLRDPVPTILSWRSFGKLPNGAGLLPVCQGRLPNAEPFWPGIQQICLADINLMEKQVLIYEAFCKLYVELSDCIEVVRYEDIIAEPDIFSRLLKRKISYQVDVADQNSNPKYPWEDRGELEALLASKGKYYTEFY